MLWLKVFHLLFVTAWMAGIFYLPRIVVHYVEGHEAKEDVRRLIIMADKLFRFSTIMAVLALVFGLWLWLGYNFSGNWLYLKLLFVVFLIGYHLQCLVFLLKMKNMSRIPSSIFMRIFNESALLIFIPILILVLLKPF